jgi:hypothetical protein
MRGSCIAAVSSVTILAPKSSQLFDSVTPVSRTGGMPRRKVDGLRRVAAFGNRPHDHGEARPADWRIFQSAGYFNAMKESVHGR